MMYRSYGENRCTEGTEGRPPGIGRKVPEDESRTTCPVKSLSKLNLALIGLLLMGTWSCAGGVTPTSSDPPALKIATTSLPSGTVGVAYSATLSATGGTPPYNWSLALGSLPAGLLLQTTTGQISGTPTQTGQFHLTVQVNDSSLPSPRSTTQALNLSVSAATLTVGAVSPSMGPSTGGSLVTITGQGFQSGLAVQFGSTTATGAQVISSAEVRALSPPQTASLVSVTVRNPGGQSGTLANAYTFLGVDPYGGSTQKPCPAGPAAHFFTQKIANRWWLCTPAGNAFWMQGVFNVDTDGGTDWLGVNNDSLEITKYGSRPAWANSVLWRLQAWGFNTVGEQGTYLALYPTYVPQPPILMPYTMFAWPSLNAIFNRNNYAPGPSKSYAPGIKLSLPALSGLYASAGVRQADPFDSNFGAWLLGDLKNDPYETQYYAGSNNSYGIGWVVDDADSVALAKAGVDFQTIRNGLLESGHGSSEPHYGYMTLISAPEHVVDYPGADPELNAPLLYTDPQFYAKSALATWLQQTGDKAPGYASIGALNAAWGSNYAGFSSAASSWMDVIGTGDGTTKTFVFLLSHTPVAPESALIKVGGVAIAGDDGSGPTAVLATSKGSLQVGASGTIDYTTGAVSITFNSPPASGAIITAQYKIGGWGSGAGLLDEDGTCPSRGSNSCWLPSDGWSLAGPKVTAAFKTDMDNFLFHLAKQYFSTVKAQLNAVDPGRLYLCDTNMGGWAAPTRAPVYQAAALYCDVLSFSQLPGGFASDDQARVNFVAQWGGDKPWIEWVGIAARPDSYQGTAGNPNGPTDTSAPPANTQQQRGTTFTSEIKTFQTMTDSTYNTVHVVGYRFWAYLDSRGEGQNWGLVDLRDNAYDGAACNLTGLVDPWGFAIQPETQLTPGGCYGDFISSVKSVNQAWLTIP